MERLPVQEQSGKRVNLKAYEPRAGRTRRSIFWSLVKYGFLSAGALLVLLPFLEMFVGALRTPSERVATPPSFWPEVAQWQIYRQVFTDLPMLKWYTNSLFITVAVTALQLLTSTTAGFALAKYRFRGRDVIFRAVLGAQMFPFFLFLIPLFFIMRFFPLAGGNDLFGQGGFGLLGTYAAIILPFTVTYYGIFLMRQFMLSIPDALLDAARIDGASEFRIFWSVVLPLLKPALVTLGVFVFLYQWNEFIWTLTVTRTNPELQPLTVGVYLMQSAYDTPSGQSLRQAALAVSVVPLVLVFLTLQRYYVKGLTMTGIKG
jgi:multiple sugar transport system permease protein